MICKVQSDKVVEAAGTVSDYGVTQPRPPSELEET